MILRPVRPESLLGAAARFRRMLAASNRVLSAAAAAKTGRITGLVTGNGKPLRGICVEDTPVNNGIGYGAVTGKNGRYTLRHVVPGRYHVVFAGFGCPDNGELARAGIPRRQQPVRCLRGQGGTVVKVTSGHVTRGINAHLRRGGELTGTVTAKSGRKLRGICVDVTGVVPGGDDPLRSQYVGHRHVPPARAVPRQVLPGLRHRVRLNGELRARDAPTFKIDYRQHVRVTEVLGPARA